MSDPKPRTKREVELCRAAYIVGVADERADALEDRFLTAAACERYPTPTKRVTRPRIACLPGLTREFRLNGRALEFREHASGGWCTYLSSEHTELLKELLANPTETVEVEVE